jgi:hypothetical protein
VPPVTLSTHARSAADGTRAGALTEVVEPELAEPELAGAELAEAAAELGEDADGTAAGPDLSARAASMWACAC